MTKTVSKGPVNKLMEELSRKDFPNIFVYGLLALVVVFSIVYIYVYVCLLITGC